jgi:hypothetical protein
VKPGASVRSAVGLTPHRDVSIIVLAGESAAVSKARIVEHVKKGMSGHGKEKN